MSHSHYDTLLVELLTLPLSLDTLTLRYQSLMRYHSLVIACREWGTDRLWCKHPESRDKVVSNVIV